MSEDALESQESPGAPAEALTHVDASGKAAMVDVSAKPETLRRAVARGHIRMKLETAALIGAGRVAKGSVLTVARVAGVMAAKKCPELIPLAHPLLLTDIQVELELLDDRVEIEAVVCADWKTGVEMEALAAVTVAALTVYDMCKAVDRTMVIEAIRVIHKSGGKTTVDQDPLE
ncbi:MAG TPA: cyclic pyranopterin monophosphate synthase MoaC [Armatimonadota bacterium]|nr:cyclic pyranopterin monophosphate synthase MoaC [Armatimonadota bacterium]